MSGRRIPNDAFFGIEEVRPVRLGEPILAELSRAVLDGRLKPGDTLPSEKQIALRFGVSKQIAREAMRNLSTIGVLDIQQGKMSRIKAISEKPFARFFRFATLGSAAGIVDATELRRLLEPPIAGIAAQRRTVEDLVALDKTLVLMEKCNGDYRRFIDADLCFHQLVVSMAKNRLIALQMGALASVISEALRQSRRNKLIGRQQLEKLVQHHTSIAEALRTGDTDQAIFNMTAHFDCA